MKILVVKTSSMGDIIHALPAVTDIAQNFPKSKIDWVVEESFAEIPGWHRAVNRIIPVALRGWQKKPWTIFTKKYRSFWTQIRDQNYDLIIDAQGLLKSALLGCIAKGQLVGPDFHGARETIAALFYKKRYPVPYALEAHPIERNRLLFSHAGQYELTNAAIDYGTDLFQPRSLKARNDEPFVLFAHGTSRDYKLWPTHHWKALAHHFIERGFRIKLPWGTPAEKQRAHEICQSREEFIEVLPRSSLTQIARTIRQAKVVVAVDTGLGHLSAALNIPSISLYGKLSPTLIGTVGRYQYHLQTKSWTSNSVNLKELSVDEVWERTEHLLNELVTT